MPDSKDDKDGIAEWLCTHPATGFCPKCIPPEEKKADEKYGSEDTTATHSGKFDVIPYAQMMAEKQALCRFKHAASTSCHLCAPPQPLSYRGKPKCDGGHRPWPRGICGRCAPSNAVLRLQSYRYCDGISFKDVSAGERFIGEWNKNPGMQRAAILFGRYITEPTRPKDSGAIRAEVDAVYIQPQRPKPDGVQLLRHAHSDKVHQVANALGLEAVGWAITTLPRSSVETGGDVLLSGLEVRQAAQYQLNHSNELGQSRFVTMVIQHNKKGEIEPHAYQISDQGVAMERDGLLADGSKSWFVSPRKPAQGEFMPSIVYKNNALKPGEDFVPDELLVKVVAMKPFKPKNHSFKYLHFPLFQQSESHVKKHFELHLGEPLHEACSDFALMAYLPSVVELDLVLEVAKCVRQQVPLPNDIRQLFEAAISRLK